MKKTLKYSILRYMPSHVTGESINLGILFYDQPTGRCQFRHTRNYNRIMAFDEEISRKSIEVLLEGIEQEVNKGNKESFDMDKFIKYYINNFKFEKPHSIEYDNLDETQERLFTEYFSQDTGDDIRVS